MYIYKYTICNKKKITEIHKSIINKYKYIYIYRFLILSSKITDIQLQLYIKKKNINFYIPKCTKKSFNTKSLQEKKVL